MSCEDSAMAAGTAQGCALGGQLPCERSQPAYSTHADALNEQLPCEEDDAMAIDAAQGGTLCGLLPCHGQVSPPADAAHVDALIGKLPCQGAAAQGDVPACGQPALQTATCGAADGGSSTAVAVQECAPAACGWAAWQAPKGGARGGGRAHGGGEGATPPSPYHTCLTFTVGGVW